MHVILGTLIDYSSYIHAPAADETIINYLYTKLLLIYVYTTEKVEIMVLKINALPPNNVHALLSLLWIHFKLTQQTYPLMDVHPVQMKQQEQRNGRERERKRDTIITRKKNFLPKNDGM